MPDLRVGTYGFLPAWLTRWSNADTMMNASLFVFLGLFSGLWLDRTRQPMHRWVVTWVGLVGVIFLSEVGQLLLLNRPFDWDHSLSAAFGTLCGMAVLGMSRWMLKRAGIRKVFDRRYKNTPSMRILIYGINYSPELTGIGKYTGEMGAWLAKHDQEVDVITAHPYYPEWAIHDSHKNKGWHTEQIGGARVHRCPLYVPRKVTSLTRILHEFSFVASSLVYWFRILFRKRYDAVICLSPPFHLGVIPVLYSKLFNVPLWCHIQDLQIDMAKDLGMIKNKRFLDIMFKVEAFILKNCTVVSTISEGMVRKVTQKKVLQSECVLFPNWVDGEYVRPLSRSQSLRAELGLRESDKVILYSGSLGEKQGLEIIIEAARSFTSRPDVQFLIFGSGGGKDKLMALAQSYGLPNIKFYPLQPYEKLSALLATADIHLVLQKKSASDLVLPSKLTGILAAGGCALVSAVPGTTLHDIVSKHNMGILIEPESVEALKDAINENIATDLTSYRMNARRYAERNLDKENILNTFLKQLVEVAGVPDADPVVEKSMVLADADRQLNVGK
ncbi:WcaI family glycosyltransferase [Larkinella insperata]|uniref:WcaI family glycosyltransferase n=1 Tax=Larkinella insperata TaxID=332158 RepID=A0ABW3QEI0_9BACT|nr:WcaI family glycosyltransferase [Larkinella insperata]